MGSQEHWNPVIVHSTVYKTCVVAHDDLSFPTPLPLVNRLSPSIPSLPPTLNLLALGDIRLFCILPYRSVPFSAAMSDAKEYQATMNRRKASGQRDEFSQRIHDTYQKVDQEMDKNAKQSDNVQDAQAASKGVMKREKMQNAHPYAKEKDVQAKVDAEGDNNSSERSTQQAQDVRHKEAQQSIHAERQHAVALQRAAAVFDDVQKSTFNSHDPATVISTDGSPHSGGASVETAADTPCGSVTSALRTVVPSMEAYERVQGEDDGLGDGARLAARVQDMEEL